MQLATIHSRASVGIEAPPVAVEIHLSSGLPAFHIVGLPEATVKESKERVRSALINSRFEFPAGRITVNLAPADLPKEGGRFDLPIALGILAASRQLITESLAQHEFIGELGLGGELRPVKACLPAAIRCGREHRSLILPEANATEASLFRQVELFSASSLLEVVAHINGQQRLTATPPAAPLVENNYPDLSEVRGQASARRALEIAAAGGHNLLLVGPPGTGKTLLANRLPGILPPLTEDELLGAAAIQSVAGRGMADGFRLQRPFRAPHHTASAVALVGGGSQPRPGEISLAHNGVLFLDELAEFPRKVLDVLREPLESGEIVVSRASRQICFPANFQLIAAMNPCPCGYDGDTQRQCRCTPDQIIRYRGRLSGPLLDRIDLQVTVPRMPAGALQKAPPSENSASVRQRVQRARQRQLARANSINAAMSLADMESFCQLDSKCQQLLEVAEEKLGLSGRAQHRIIKVARTIADIEGLEDIGMAQLREALGYRGFGSG